MGRYRGEPGHASLCPARRTALDGALCVLCVPASRSAPDLCPGCPGSCASVHELVHRVFRKLLPAEEGDCRVQVSQVVPGDRTNRCRGDLRSPADGLLEIAPIPRTPWASAGRPYGFRGIQDQGSLTLARKRAGNSSCNSSYTGKRRSDSPVAWRRSFERRSKAYMYP